jgi:hypothetical protein
MNVSARGARALLSIAMTASGSSACGDSGPPQVLDRPGVQQECARHADCVEAYDEPYLCREGSCVRLKNSARNDNSRNRGDDSGDCSLVLGTGNLRRDDADVFVIGALASRYPYADELGVPVKVYAGAVIDFEQQFDPTALRIDGKARLPVVVVCDVSETPSDGLVDERLERTLDHLAVRLGVPGIIAPLWPAKLAHAFEYTHGQGKNVFLLSPFESIPTLLALEDGGLVWHMLGDATKLAPTYAQAVHRAQAWFWRTRGKDDTKPLRLALVSSDQPNHDELANGIERELFSEAGKGLPVGNFARFSIESSQTSWAPNVAPVLDGLRAFRPDVVVVTGGYEFIVHLLRPLEQDWPLTAGSEPRPFYVLSPTLRATVGTLGRDVAAIPGLEDRLVGVAHAGAEDGRIRAKYIGRQFATFPISPAEFDGAEAFYDAFYFMMYAAAAAGGTALTGDDLARGMTRLLNGVPFEVGVGDLRAAGTYLRSGKPIALQGALGPPSFDPGTGARLGSGSLWCVDTREGDQNRYIDGLRFDETTGELEGEFPCFDGF